MIVKEPENKIVSSGISSTQDFGIKASSKAFRVLSKSIYKNPIEAIIRELSTNAVDAHIEAGTTDQQFRVTVPTNLNPVFQIRDYGTGLSEQQVYSIYTTYFESTKEESNDYNGTLGLGSKSPFAYSNMFTITSFYKQVKSMYIATLGANGTPSISLAGSEPTDEPNGMEISISVKRDDIHNFSSSAIRVYAFFADDKKPKCNIDLGTIFTKIQDFDGGFMYEFPSYYSRAFSNGSHVVQSNVRYPIDVDAIEQMRPNVDPAILDLLERNLILTVNNGEVNFAPSREELEYTDVTMDTIISYMERIVKDWSKQVDDKLDGATTKFERTKMFNQIRRDRHLYLNGMENKYELCDETFSLPPNSFMYHYGSTKKAKTRHVNEKWVLDTKTKVSSLNTETVTKKNRNIWDHHKSPTFYTWVGNEGMITAFENWRTYDEYGYENDYFIKASTQDDLNIILDSLGNPEYTELNPILEKKKKTVSTAYEFDLSELYAGQRISSQTGERVFDDIADLDGFYIYVNTFATFERPNGVNSMSKDSIALLNSLKSLGLDSIGTFYAIRETDRELVKENKKLKPLHKEVISRLKTIDKIDTKYYDYVNGLYYTHQYFLDMITENVDAIDDEDIKKLVSSLPVKVENVKQKISIQTDVNSLIHSLKRDKVLIDAHRVDQQKTDQNEIDEFRRTLQKVMGRYPLYGTGHSQKEVVKYINAMWFYRKNHATKENTNDSSIHA